MHEKMPWVSSALKANGTLVWSHGYRSAPLDGDCKVDFKLFKDPYVPKCKLGWNDWEGSIATSFKTGTNPDKLLEVNLFSHVGKNKWCTNGTVSGHNCFKQAGNKLIHAESEVTSELQPNGDIKWSHGYTSRLYNTCRVEECNASFGDMDGMVYRSFKTWDPQHETVEEFELLREGNKWCSYGQKSNKNCYFRKANKLHHDKYSFITGTLLPDGRIKWSHGYTSQAEVNPCAECKISLEDWNGKKAESFKTDDPEKKMVETFDITLEDD